MAETVDIRPLKIDDLESVNHLFTKVFGKKRSLEHWQWKYFRNPHGEAIASVGVQDNQIVGLYGLIPRKVWWFNQLKTAWQEVDLMVDPDHGRGGLFKHLGQASYQRVQEQEHPFTFGFPNQTSLPLGRRILGWRAIAPIPLWTMLLKPAEVLKGKIPGIPGAGIATDAVFKVYHSYRLRGSSDCEVKRLDTIPDRINKLTSIRRTEIEFVRDKDYLNWRYIDCPDKDYQVYGIESEDNLSALAVVGIGDDGRASICDFLGRREENTRVKTLVKRIARDCRQVGCHSLRVWAIQDNQEADFFKSMGFINRNALNFHVIRSFRSPEFNRRLWDPARWYVSSGDSDCV